MARLRLKPLHEQVVVVLGASSGIGRECALRFAARGAKVVVAARGETGLASLVREIRASGGEATYCVCDASDAEQVSAVAKHAVDRYGRIDTWVNVAAVGSYAMLEDIPSEDFRRVLDVNVTGHLHGVQAALPHLRREGRGALIFVSSIESTVAMPLQGAYATSKHAVQGLVETLRRELRASRTPVSVTDVKPPVISTPFYTNALSRVGFRPTAPPPVYHPSVVADCVLYAAEHPVRSLYAGGSARVMTLMQLYTPGLLDEVVARVGIPLQETTVPPGSGALYEPCEDTNRVDGDIAAHAFRFSPYTWLQIHPKAKALVTVVTAGLVGRVLARRALQGR